MVCMACMACIGVIASVEFFCPAFTHFLPLSAAREERSFETRNVFYDQRKRVLLTALLHCSDPGFSCNCEF